jgi:hypothetical protein
MEAAPSERLAEGVILDHDHPWPGLVSFSEANSPFFFGRERETEELARLVRQETLTVFFGKSGLGKSSILRAGVSPILREAEFVPIYIRLNHDEAAPPLEDQVEIAIEEVLDREQIDASKPIRAETLWEYFHKKDNDWWDIENRLVKPVLIFDQFEELMTLGHENPARATRTASFLSELEDLVENRPPAALVERFKQERDLADQYDHRRTAYRVVISLREDFLPDLEGLRGRLRAVMLNRLRLLPMNGEQALDVVLKPGRDLVDEDVAVRIVDFVSSSERSRLQSAVTRAQLAKRAVEPALLSVVLQELNTRRIKADQAKITPELVGKTNPTEIFHDFYVRGLGGMDGAVREFIEDCLLTSSGARNRIAEEDAMTKRGISQDIISKLIDRRIIQRETTGNSKWLELTHDTLADVVRTDRAAHQQQRELERVAAREQEARRKLRRAQKLALGFAGLLVIALLALGFAVYEQRRAQSAQQRAQTAQALTTRATDELAVGILRNIEQNPRIRTDEKLFLSQRLSVTLRNLRAKAGTSTDLSLRLADLCATASVMLFDCGRIDEATTYARTAQDLIAAPVALTGQNALTLARIELAAGLVKRYGFQLDDAIKTFTKAEDTLRHADRTEDAIPAAVLRAKVTAAHAEALGFKGQGEEGEKLARAAISQTEGILKSIQDKTTERTLWQEILRLQMICYRVVTINRLGQHMSDVHERFNRALGSAKPFFSDGDDPIWRYYEAKSIQAQAVLQQHNESQDEALKSMKVAVEKLHDLLLDDPQNIWLRAELGSALAQQNGMARVAGDLDQVKLNCEAVRKLAMTILRDQRADYFSFYLAGFADSQEETLASAVSYLARAEIEARRLPASNILLEQELAGHRQCLTLMLQNNRNQEAVQQVQAALAILDQMDSHGPPHLDLRLDVLGEFLRSDANKIGRERWLSVYNTAQEACSRLSQDEPGRFTTIAFLTSLRADQNLQDKEYSEALDLFEKAAAMSLKAIDTRQDQELNLKNYLYMQSGVIRASTGLGKWDRVAAASHDARVKLEDMLKAQPRLAAVLPLLERVLAAGDNATKTLQEQDAKAKGSEQLAAEVAALRQTRDELRRLNAGSGGLMSAAKRIDLQQFDLSKMRTGTAQNYWVVKQRLSWSHEPIYPGPWRTLVGDEFETAMSTLVLPDMVSTDEIERIRVSPLSFYQDGRLIEAEYLGPNGYSLTASTLVANGKAYFLDGTSHPIHKANSEAPLHLTSSEDAVAYLRFFCSYLRGDEGSFSIVESAADLPWVAWAPPDLKADVERLLRPLAVWPDKGAEGQWLATATIDYGNALFHARLRISKDGNVDMPEDVPVAANMPFNQVVYKSGGRAGKLERLDLRAIDPPGGDTEVESRLGMAESKEKRPANYVALADGAAELQSEIVSIVDDPQSKKTLLDVLTRTRDLHRASGDETGAAKCQARVEKLKREVILSDLLGESWQQLVKKDFAGALASTEKGLKVDPQYLPLQTNRAHALLFLGRTAEAETIYRQYIGQTVKLSGRSWEAEILNDFEELEKAGLTNPEINRIREILKSAPTDQD